MLQYSGITVESGLPVKSVKITLNTFAVCLKTVLTKCQVCQLVLDVVDNYIRVKTFFDIAVQCDTKEINVVEQFTHV